MEAGKVGSFRQDQLLAAVATSLTRSEAAVHLARGAPSSAAAVPLLCRFSDACMTTLSARADGRRTKSANGRNRERRRDYGAAGSTRV